MNLDYLTKLVMYDIETIRIVNDIFIHPSSKKRKVDFNGEGYTS